MQLIETTEKKDGIEVKKSSKWIFFFLNSANNIKVISNNKNERDNFKSKI